MKKSKRTKKRLLLLSLLTIIGVPSFFGIANAMILNGANGKIHRNAAAMPHHRVGIVLGCSPTTGQFKNPFFVGRISAAAELYRQGKVDRLLVSGDNGRVDYDEPTAMAAALVAKGVPSEHIAKDYAGFRTLDTMVRARKVFNLVDAAIITDDFHMARSIYYAEQAGLKVDGYPSKAPNNPVTVTTEFREAFARGRAVIDEAVNSQPKFLGKLEPIP